MAGKSASQLLALWQSSLVAMGKSGLNRVDRTIYFGEAFGWSIPQSAALNAWHGFKDKNVAWTDEMTDARYAQLLEEWRQNPPPPRPTEAEEDAALALWISTLPAAELEELTKSLEMD